MLNKFKRLIYWYINGSGIRDDDMEDVLAEVNLYVCEQWHRYDPKKSSPQTFLLWQVKGAVRRWRRREVRFYKNVKDIARILGEANEEDLLEEIIDPNQLDGRDIEEQIVMRATLLKVLKMAEERGIDITLDSYRVNKRERGVLKSIWLDVLNRVDGK